MCAKCYELTELNYMFKKLVGLRLFDAAPKFALFSVSSLKDEQLTEKQTYMKTETCKLYSIAF